MTEHKTTDTALVPNEKGPQDSQFGGYQEIPVTRVRKIIAERLTSAKQEVPHFYLTVDCRLDNLSNERDEHNASKCSTENLTFNDFFIKACALALRETPLMNVSWSGKSLLKPNDIDISVAVNTQYGVITPVIRQADRKPLTEISREIKHLSARARDGRLKPDEYKGGSLTVSNLGMFGVREFLAIINPPQSAILAVGSAQKRVIVESDSPFIATMLTMSLSVDHRAVDGAVAAQYLQALVEAIESPEKLLSE